MQIHTNTPCCTVIVTVDGSNAAIAAVLAHATSGLERFADHDGFLAGATHLSQDGTRIVQYLQWRDEAAYTACMASPAWESIPSSRDFMHMMARGEIAVDARVFGVTGCLG